MISAVHQTDCGLIHSQKKTMILKRHRKVYYLFCFPIWRWTTWEFLSV